MRLLFSTLLLAVFALTAQTAKASAPTNIAYMTPVIYVINQPMAENVPLVSGDVPFTFSVGAGGAPLPEGITLDPFSGILSGTPTVLTDPMDVIIDVANAYGISQGVVNIGVIPETPPAQLSYQFNPVVYSVNVPIVNNRPSNLGGAASAWSIDPPLPGGLFLDPLNGQISGTPSVAIQQGQYNISACNSAGCANTLLTLTINPARPSIFTYQLNPASYEVGSRIADNVPNISPNPLNHFRIWSAVQLPAGLSLDPNTGVISGVPTQVSPPSEVLILGSDDIGNGVMVALTIDVKASVSCVKPTLQPLPRNTCKDIPRPVNACRDLPGNTKADRAAKKVCNDNHDRLVEIFILDQQRCLSQWRTDRRAVRELNRNAREAYRACKHLHADDDDDFEEDNRDDSED